MPRNCCLWIAGLTLWCWGWSLTSLTQAADYYVSPSGLDGNAGTSGSPWQTIAKVNGVNFKAGDRIFFQGGQTFNGKLYFDANDLGSAANPIQISSYGTGHATINGGSSDAFYAYNTAGITISNLDFTGAGATCTGTGIVFYNDLAGNVKLPHIYIDNVQVSGFKGGITIGAWNGTSGFSDLRITHASVHDNWGNNIVTFGQTDYALSTVYIGHCQTFNSAGDPNKMDVSSGNGIVMGSVDGCTIERCLSYNNGWLCAAPSGPAGIWCYQSRAVTIQYNEAWQNHGVNADGDGFDLDGDTSNSILQYNYSHDNDAAGFLVCEFSGAPGPNANNVVRYNISQNDCRKRAYGGIHFYNAGVGLQNCEVYNNTVYLSKPAFGDVPAVDVYSPTTNVHLRNNIFMTSGGASLVTVAAGQSGLLFDHNCYWSSGSAFGIQYLGTNYATLAAWRTASGQEASVALNTDPLLVAAGTGGTLGDADKLVSLGAYKLQSSSPLLNAGLNLAVQGVPMGATDFYGSAIPQGTGFEIGAHEFVPVVNTPPSSLLTAPAKGSSYIAPATIILTASASDSDGSVSAVDFYAGSTRIGSVTSSPYTLTWSNVAAGNYTLTAVATDNLGAKTTSAGVSITVSAPINSPPVIMSAASASPSVAISGTAIAFSVGASDPDGDALSYSWTFGDGVTGSGASVSHVYATAGIFTATVTVTDGRGGTVSSSVSVTIQAPAPRSVHVAAIGLKVSTSRKGTAAMATVTLQDDLGSPVSGATVYGNWSGLTSASVAGNTGSAGTIVFTSARTKSVGAFTFTISKVSAAGYTYAASQNTASSATISSAGAVTLSAAPIAMAEPAVEEDVFQVDATAGQSFKVTLPLPANLAGAKNVRASAEELPKGVRISQTVISGRPTEVGAFAFTIRIQGKLKTSAQATLQCTLNVSGN